MSHTQQINVLTRVSSLTQTSFLKGRMQQVGGAMVMKGIVQVEIRHVGVVSRITKETAVKKHNIQIHI